MTLIDGETPVNVGPANEVTPKASPALPRPHRWDDDDGLGLRLQVQDFLNIPSPARIVSAKTQTAETYFAVISWRKIGPIEPIRRTISTVILKVASCSLRVTCCMDPDPIYPPNALRVDRPLFVQRDPQTESESQACRPRLPRLIDHSAT